MNKRQAFSLVTMLLLTALMSVSAQARKTSSKYDDGITRKWELRTTVGGQYGTKNDLALLVDLGGGFNFTQNFYFGLSTGIYPKFGVVDHLKSASVIPAMLDFSFRINPESERWSPFAQVRAGVLFSAPANGELDPEYIGYGYTYKRSNYKALDLGAGFYIRPRRNVDIRFSLHYMYASPSDDGWEPVLNCNENLIQLRAGVNLRGKAKTGTRSQLNAQANRELYAERQRLHEQRQAEMQARRAEAERRAEEDRAARRAERESLANTVSATLVQELPTEFFCHVTPSMLEGSSLDNQLIKLATLATGKQLNSVIVVGYAPTDDVVKAVQNADSVRKHLNKRYYIAQDLISTTYMGFEDILKKNPRPEGAIATIIIQKSPDADKK